MKVTALAITPPPGAQECPRVTPELLASCLARYSRSNKGLEAILAGINWGDPDKSVDQVFRFLDYGHASIGGLTGGIAMAIDRCSFFLALKLFEIAQLCDGQESSTRYIEMVPASLPNPVEIGIPSQFAAEWQSVMEDAFAIYRDVYQELDRQARENPAIVRCPPGANPKVIDRIRKNYALDRSRYFIPFATETNVGLVMTARVWAQTIRQLDAQPFPEAVECAARLRAQLEKLTPRLTRHSFKDAACTRQAQQEVDAGIALIRSNGMPIENAADQVFVSVERSCPPFLPDLQSLPAAFDGKENRYSVVGSAVKRMFVRFAWNNIALAELRDLNRHRTGHRFSPLAPVGFYLPPGVSHPRGRELLERQRALMKKLASEAPATGCHYYACLLGDQVAFEHSTHADKFIYEVELRTGLGAHFRYAEHLAAAYREFVKLVPEAGPFIQIGTAEPE